MGRKNDTIYKVLREKTEKYLKEHPLPKDWNTVGFVDVDELPISKGRDKVRGMTKEDKMRKNRGR